MMLKVYVPAETAARIDAARGLVTRSAFARFAIDQALGEQNPLAAREIPVAMPPKPRRPKLRPGGGGGRVA
jgi:hypothetical protein